MWDALLAPTFGPGSKPVNRPAGRSRIRNKEAETRRQPRARRRLQGEGAVAPGCGQLPVRTAIAAAASFPPLATSPPLSRLLTLTLTRRHSALATDTPPAAGFARLPHLQAPRARAGRPSRGPLPPPRWAKRRRAPGRSACWSSGPASAPSTRPFSRWALRQAQGPGRARLQAHWSCREWRRGLRRHVLAERLHTSLLHCSPSFLFTHPSLPILLLPPSSQPAGEG